MILVNKDTGLIYECMGLLSKYMLISKGYDLDGNYYSINKTISVQEFENLNDTFVYIGEL